MQILLPDEDAAIEPVPTAGGGRKPESERGRLSNIIKVFNDQFSDNESLRHWLAATVSRLTYLPAQVRCLLQRGGQILSVAVPVA